MCLMQGWLHGYVTSCIYMPHIHKGPYLVVWFVSTTLKFLIIVSLTVFCKWNGRNNGNWLLNKGDRHNANTGRFSETQSESKVCKFCLQINTWGLWKHRDTAFSFCFKFWKQIIALYKHKKKKKQANLSHPFLLVLLPSII